MSMELGNMAFGNSRGAEPVDRDLQYQFVGWMEKLGFDCYGIRQEQGADWAFENEVFRIQPYYWGDCECKHMNACDCTASKPNFQFKPTGFRLDWYKYALRDSYSSEPLTKELIDQMFSECERSMREG